MDQVTTQQAKNQQLVTLTSFPFIIKREICLAFVFIVVSSIIVFNIWDSSQPLSFLPFSFIPTSQAPLCDYSNGRWVWDHDNNNNNSNNPIQSSYDESCPFLDPGFRCRQNGRKDVEYLKWRWQPHGCDLPRFNASDFLERSRNGRIVFAGDSIGRNQWESLICMLAQGVSNQSTIFEENGNPITKHKGFLSMKFQEYNLTIEYYRTPFLVVVNRPPMNSPAQVKVSIRVDELNWQSKRWVGANVIVLNTGHWWNKEKTLKMGCYFQEGGKLNMTMDVREGFRRSLQTIKKWVMKNLNPERSHFFLRSYSSTHYTNGTWNEGGVCDGEREPEQNNTLLEAEHWNNHYIYDVIKQMKYGKWKVQLLNITYLTEFRKDGHPSRHREPGTLAQAPQDCSHWCLPGVPDTWNEILYAHLLAMEYRTK